MSAIYRLFYRPRAGEEHTLDVDLEGERLSEAAVILDSRGRELVRRVHARALEPLDAAALEAALDHVTVANAPADAVAEAIHALRHAGA